jgi:hypothetical protein
MELSRYLTAFTCAMKRFTDLHLRPDALDCSSDMSNIYAADNVEPTAEPLRAITLLSLD